MSPEARVLASDQRHVDFARRMARTYARRLGVNADDLESAAFFGLCQAAVSYDPGSGVAFNTFAVRRIAGAIVDDCRRALFGGRRRPAPLVSLDVREFEDGGAYRDSLPSGDEPVGSGVDSTDVIEAIFRLLPGRHRRAMRLAYFDPSCETVEARARAMGCSCANFAKIQTQAHRMIREQADDVLVMAGIDRMQEVS